MLAALLLMLPPCQSWNPHDLREVTKIIREAPGVADPTLELTPISDEHLCARLATASGCRGANVFAAHAGRFYVVTPIGVDGWGDEVVLLDQRLHQMRLSPAPKQRGVR